MVVEVITVIGRKSPRRDIVFSDFRAYADGPDRGLILRRFEDESHSGASYAKDHYRRDPAAAMDDEGPRP